ncbi:MAG: EamA family transporter [Granulosicoccus sp.]
MTGILWGLCGAILIGASDCIARVTTQKVSVSILFLCIMGSSLIALLTWLIVTANLPPWHTGAWLDSAGSGVLNIVALFFLYRALARGPVAVASPAASTFTVLLLGLNILSGEPWSWLQLLAMLVVFCGVVMLVQPSSADRQMAQYDSRWLRITAVYALATALTVSVRMYLAQDASAVLGAEHALFLNRLFALATALALIAFCFLRQQVLVWPIGNMRYLVLLQAVAETCALGAFLIGSAGGGRVAATIGFAAFAAATTLFAWLWLGEKIGLQRGFWILVVSGGIVIAMLASP